MLRELLELREDAVGLAQGLARLERARAGGLPFAPEQGLAAVVRAHRLASSGDGLAQAGEALAESQADDPPKPGRVARLSALRAFLCRARAAGLEPGAAQELLELPRRPLVRLPGDAGLHGALPAVQVERELPRVRERQRRGEMERGLAEAVEGWGGPLSAGWEAAEAALGEAGGEPREAAAGLNAGGWEKASGVNLSHLKDFSPSRDGPLNPKGSGLKDSAASLASSAAEALLGGTDSLAHDLGAWLLERHTGARPHPGGAERHDLLHLVHAPPCAGAFPRGELLRTCRRWASMLGLDLGKDRRIRLDEEDPPLRPGGAAAVPVDPPDEIALFVFPEEGPRALAQLLAAVSVAQLRAGPPGDAPPEDLWLGDPAVPAACASLLGALVQDPQWLRRCARTDLRRDDERAIAWGFVLDARLAAARTLGSLAAHELGFGPRAAQAMRELYGRALGVDLPKGLALRELDPWLGSWDELRGLALAARLREYLRDRFDEDWWRNPRALPALGGLWGRGGRATVVELWAEAGGAPSMDPLLQHFAESCG